MKSTAQVLLRTWDSGGLVVRMKVGGAVIYDFTQKVVLLEVIFTDNC